jgi:dTMP kinase
MPSPLTSLSSRTGFLVAFEGIDGAGKTTQANLLGNRLREEGYDCVVFKEPTMGEWGRKIALMSKNGRMLSGEEELKYFYEDRREDVKNNIEPALEKGKIVIMDRYFYSTMAYQGAKGLDPDYIEQKNLEIAPKPDLVILLDIDTNTARDRILLRKDQPNHFEQRLGPVREIFLKIAKTRSEIKTIPGDLPVQEIHSTAYSLVIAKLEEKHERRRIVKYTRDRPTEALV